jgi:hypothetical protein
LILEGGDGNVYEILVFESPDHSDRRGVIDPAFTAGKTHFGLIERGD